MSKNKTEYGIKYKDVKSEGDVNLPAAPELESSKFKRIDVLPTLLINRDKGIQGGIKRVTSAYTANGSEHLISCDATSGTFDVTLPTLSPDLTNEIFITETSAVDIIGVRDEAGTLITQVYQSSGNAVLKMVWNGDYWEKQI